MELLRDRSKNFAEAGVHPYGISRDSAWTHIAWTQALDLNFPLLSDWNGDAVRAFDVAQDFFGLRDVPGLKKKPSTSELLDWIKLLVHEGVSPETLARVEGTMPPLAGALLKSEQDVAAMKHSGLRRSRRP